MRELSFFARVLTLFPEAFPGALGVSIPNRSKNKLWDFEVINIRDYAKDKHQTTDDKPAGGGHGMIIKPDVLSEAVISNEDGIRRKYLLSPRGRVFNQEIAHEIVSYKNVMFVCGRYEGVDQRIIDHHELEEISIGDYILSGGEVAAQAIIDSCIRLVPGVLSGKNPHLEESFNKGQYQDLLEYPQYTKPNIWNDYRIPDILLSGDHNKIAKWRLEESEKITRKCRPDLWNKYIDKKN
ncbi:MAG: tRNA (guanosine(37)-N1)-methyltransferase TrmD [Rickettsiales bacterium]